MHCCPLAFSASGSLLVVTPLVVVPSSIFCHPTIESTHVPITITSSRAQMLALVLPQHATQPPQSMAAAVPVVTFLENASSHDRLTELCVDHPSVRPGGASAAVEP